MTVAHVVTAESNLGGMSLGIQGAAAPIAVQGSRVLGPVFHC